MAGYDITVGKDLLPGLLSGQDGLAKLIESVLNQVLEAQVGESLNAERYERHDERTGYRNGYRMRQLYTRVGPITLQVPQTRDGSFSTDIFQRYQRSEQAFVLALMEMVVNGVSTRKVTHITEEPCGASFSKSTLHVYFFIKLVYNFHSLIFHLSFEAFNMFSPTHEVSSKSATGTAPSTLSLEFIWKAKSTYWAGEIGVIDIYIDNQLCFTIDIPQRDDQATQSISLPLKKHNTHFSGTSGAEVNYIIIENLDTTRKITLKAGIFNKEQGDTMTRNFDGTWSRDVRFTREDVSIDLDFSSLQLGNHYKIIATHGSERTAPDSSFWQGEGLYTIIKEHGPSRQTTVAPFSPHTAPFFSDTTSTASRSHEMENVVSAKI